LANLHCAPKLDLEGRWLRPKVLPTCDDGAGLQNVFRQFPQVLVESDTASKMLVIHQVLKIQKVDGELGQKLYRICTQESQENLQK
jgi:hypothetical protein